MITRFGWVDLRWMRPCESEAVAFVLRRCFPGEDWTSDDVNRFLMAGRNAVKPITLEDNTVIGCLLYRIGRHEISIARVAVLRKYRRNKIGTFAVKSLTGQTSMFRRRRFIGKIRENDGAAWTFARRCGFAGSSVMAGHYGELDAYLMEVAAEKGRQVRRPLLTAIS